MSVDHQPRPVVASALVKARIKPELRGAIEKAAAKRQMTVSTWLRTAALTSLMLEGIGTVLHFPDEPA